LDELRSVSFSGIIDCNLLDFYFIAAFHFDFFRSLGGSALALALAFYLDIYFIFFFVLLVLVLVSS
jgi:hypothetical protein